MGLLSCWCCIACDVVLAPQEWVVRMRMPWMGLMGGDGHGDEVEMQPSGVAGKRASTSTRHPHVTGTSHSKQIPTLLNAANTCV
jgi:hypothetical protein